MTSRRHLRISGGWPERDTCGGDGERWVDPHRYGGNREKWEAPYSYSEFFIFRNVDRATLKRMSADYSDRLWQWSPEKFDAAVKKASGHGQRFYQYTAAQASTLLSAYYDRPVECVALAEGCNVGNGYPYWIFWHRDAAGTERVSRDAIPADGGGA